MAKKNFKDNMTTGIETLLKSTIEETPVEKKEEKEFVKYNYILEKNMHKKLKLQSVIEERPIVDILHEALTMYFEKIEE